MYMLVLTISLSLDLLVFFSALLRIYLYFFPGNNVLEIQPLSYFSNHMVFKNF